MQEILALPPWERMAWHDIFDLYGILDWRREDFLHAASLQATCGGKDLRDFVLFPEPTMRQERRETDEEAVLRAFGYVEKP